MINSARPSANAKLAFHFGQGPYGESCVPKIIWVELEGEDGKKCVKQVERDGNGVKIHKNLLVQAMDKVSHPNPEPRNLPLNHYQCTRKFKLNHDIVLHHRAAHMFDNSVPNMSVFKFTDGVQGLLWRGPVTFYSCKGVKLDRLANRVPDLDVTMSDLHVALSFLQNKTGSNAGPEALSAGGLFLYEVYEPLLFQQLIVRYSKNAKPIKGIRISCLGDIQHLRKEEYQVVDILPNHPIFHADQPDPHAAVLKQLGIPLIARKLISDEDLQPRKGLRSRVGYEVLENEVAIALNLITDVNSHRFNFPDLGAHWKKVVGPVVLVREDGKRLTIHQVQALVAFCKHKVDWNDALWMAMLTLGMERLDHFVSIEIRQNEVREIMKNDETLKAQFQEFFEEFKREKISGDDEGEVDGDPSWADEASPYDV
ncbi:uncharacterized protein EAE98_002806 [Botrytis deweyae]|uniref:RNA ligase domain-containing protein n=1 Tax=Botrytis deweyae TaxID=2478750 RepID=A0ABQ7IUS4_9HELO|nr:uncharacterized protein EAE98_002806 [Botrytis deweyae]KAF7934761.1 hypothetical protein EAE98_002806 [Botrytis deweyae]